MSVDRHERRAGGLWVLAGMVALMWLGELVDLAPGVDLDRYGIEPRDTDGLDGVVAAPLLHANFAHLISNTVPFVLMGAVIALAGAVRLLIVTGIAAIVSGLGTWLVAPAHSVHIGASGVVFGFAAYLIARGLFSRRLGELAIGAVVVAVWGASLLAGILTPGQGISWQAHLFGAIGGLLAARLLAPRDRSRSSVGA